MIAYIDADIICHQAIHASMDEWEDGFVLSERGVRDVIIETMDKWVEKIRPKPTTIVPVLSDYHNNWRYALGGPYKLNRSGGGADSKREHMQFARAFVRSHWPKTMQEEGLEADDLIGIMCSHPDHQRRSVAVSIDKDFLTLPGQFYNPRGGGRRPLKIKAMQADYMWMTQTLTGDTVDNYKGIPGIGPKKAEAILDGCIGIWDMWEAVLRAYKKAKLPVKDALLNARYARILRFNDWDPDKKAVRLFTGRKDKEKWLTIDPKTMARPSVKDE